MIPNFAPLVALSSFRALKDCSPEIAKNQLRAKRSWEAVFDQIIYFGELEPALASARTTFVPTADFPAMSTVLLAASWGNDLTAIINADIVVLPILKEAIQAALSGGAVAMTSQRFEFDPVTEDYAKAKVVDMGIDFFAAWPNVWKDAALRVPDELRWGGNQWDTWLSSYFNMSLQRRFVSLSRYRAILHPRHGDRKRPEVPLLKDDYWTQRPGFPAPI